jgi:hypothetical protein
MKPHNKHGRMGILRNIILASKSLQTLSVTYMSKAINRIQAQNSTYMLLSLACYIQ